MKKIPAEVRSRKDFRSTIEAFIQNLGGTGYAKRLNQAFEAAEQAK
jgi:hypothetical protein